MPLGFFADESGIDTVDSRPVAVERLAVSLECFPAPPRRVARCGHAPVLELPLTYIRDPIALVRDRVAIVRDPIALVGDPVSLVRVALALVKLAASLLQPGGLRTRALSRLTSSVGDPTRLTHPTACGFYAPPPRPLLSEIGTLLEHLGGARKGLVQALWVHRRTPRRERRVDPRLELVGDALALIRGPFAVVGCAFALVGEPISLGGGPVSPIKLPAPLLQPGGRRTRALGRLTSPLSNSTFLSHLIMSAVVQVPASVILGQTGGPIERLGRPREELRQALGIHR